MSTPPSKLIVGAGAQGRVVLEVWRAMHPSAQFLFLDDRTELHGQDIMGARVAGPSSLLGTMPGEVIFALGNNELRARKGDELLAQGGTLGVVVHPTAFVSPTASIGAGTVVFAMACINTAAQVGPHVIINTGVIVEHDGVIGAGASLSPGVKTGGRVEIGASTFVSTGVTLAARARVGAGSVIGAGSVVLGDLPGGILAYGVPARRIREVTPQDFQRVL